MLMKMYMIQYYLLPQNFCLGKQQFKLFHSLLYQETYIWIIKKILPDKQSGFCTVHSWNTALLNILDDIIKSCDDGNITILALLNYFKAFDTRVMIYSCQFLDLWA